MSGVPRIVADMPVRFFKRDLKGFTLEGRSLFRRGESKVYEVSIPRALDRAQGGQPALNACLLIVRGLSCDRKGRGAELKFESVIDEKGQPADKAVKPGQRNLPSFCLPCWIHPRETCTPYHDYDGNSGVKAGQVRYFRLSNQGKIRLKVEGLTFACALIAIRDDGASMRYENVPFSSSPPSNAGGAERVGLSIEDTKLGYKAWGQLLPSDGQVSLPWASDIILDSGGRQPSDISLLYLYNVKTAKESHGYIRCTMGDLPVGEQFVGPNCNSPLLFDFTNVGARLFGSSVRLTLECEGTSVNLQGNIEPFFITV